jgi:N-formylglutamate amidohydrolase
VAAGHLPQALNVPYAGGYILERHGAPERGIHAIQLEIDRSLYLDSRMDGAGPGHGRIVQLVREILDALADEAIAGPERLAAE